VHSLAKAKDVDERYGLFCEERIGRGKRMAPPAEVVVKQHRKNAQLIEDYSVWFSNWR
jgi:hypothetical protein